VISSQLCRMVVQRAEEEGVVCPSICQKNLLTMFALDNIDHKPTSSTSAGEFHGTSISVFQLPLSDCMGELRSFRSTFENAEISGARHVPELPDWYSTMPEYTPPVRRAVPTTCSLAEVANLMPSS